MTVCSQCRERPATCFGQYDGAEKPEPACDTCCGHGNEDGWCEPICEDCLNATGGRCPAHAEPECTCYELTGGHQPGCAFNHQRQGGAP